MTAENLSEIRFWRSIHKSIVGVGYFQIHISSENFSLTYLLYSYSYAYWKWSSLRKYSQLKTITQTHTLHRLHVPEKMFIYELWKTFSHTHTRQYWTGGDRERELQLIYLRPMSFEDFFLFRWKTITNHMPNSFTH